MLRRPAVVEWSAVTLLYLALAVVVTWPVAIHWGSAIYGFGNDNWGGIWAYHWLHEAAFGSGKSSFSPELQAPFGYVLQTQGIQPIDRLFAVLFGGFSGGLVAYNLQIFVSFVLGGLSMYALGRYLTGSRLAAALAGVIFAGSPFHLAFAMQYTALSTIEFCPLFVLALLVALRSRRLRDAALAGAAFAGVWFSSYYYGWMGIWFAVAVLVAAGARGLIAGARRRDIRGPFRSGARFVGRSGVVGVAAFALLTVPVLAGLALKVQANQQQFGRTLADLYEGSVRPWMFVLPPHDNPVFSHLTSPFIQAHLGQLPNYEQAVYLGAVPVLLALVGVVLRRRMSVRARFAWPLLTVGALFCILLSLGPYLPLNPFKVGDWTNTGGVNHINNVTYYLFKLSSNFRFYGRAFVWVSISLAVLAAIGFAAIEPRLRRIGRVAPLVAAALLAGLVMTEFMNRPNSQPSWLNEVSPAWVKAVQTLPKGSSIVDYPISGLNSPRSLFYMFWQPRHGHPTENPAVSPRAGALGAALADPNQVGAGAAAHRSGLEYFVIHTHLPPPTSPLYQGVLPDDSLSPATGAQNPWLQRVARVDDAVIYRVLSKPRPLTSPLAQYGAGFGGPEIEGGLEWHWLQAQTGTLDALSPSARHATLTFSATSFAQARRLQVYAGGRLLATVKVAGQPAVRTVRVPLRLHRGANQIRVQVSPSPVVADWVMHNGDPRPLALRLGNPVIR